MFNAMSIVNNGSSRRLYDRDHALLSVRSDHKRSAGGITQATLSQLHWLPVHDHIKFKIDTMTHKGKGKGQDTCYSAAYMSQTRDQQRFYNLGSGS